MFNHALLQTHTYHSSFQIIDGEHVPRSIDELVEKVKQQQQGNQSQRRATLYSKFGMDSNMEYAKPGITFPIANK